MAKLSLLEAAAHAFAMVSFADAEISPSEQRRFKDFVGGELDLKEATPDQTAAAWDKALADVEASQSFGGPLVQIRTSVSSTAERALIMRAAQAAVVADEVDEPQEDSAIWALAEALGLKPEDY